MTETSTPIAPHAHVTRNHFRNASYPRISMVAYTVRTLPLNDELPYIVLFAIITPDTRVVQGSVHAPDGTVLNLLPIDLADEAFDELEAANEHEGAEDDDDDKDVQS